MKAEDALALAMKYTNDAVAAAGSALKRKEYTINLTTSNNWYALDNTITNDNTDFVIGSLQIATTVNNNVVAYPNGYNDGYINVQIYVANDSGLSFYGKADVAAGSTFKVVAFVKEKKS